MRSNVIVVEFMSLIVHKVITIVLSVLIKVTAGQQFVQLLQMAFLMKIVRMMQQQFNDLILSAQEKKHLLKSHNKLNYAVIKVK